MTVRDCAIVERHLPPGLLDGIRPDERWWRGRAILVLWVRGYPLEMAWSGALAEEPGHSRFLHDAMERVDDARLERDLATTVAIRAADTSVEAVAGSMGSFVVRHKPGLVTRVEPRDPP